MSKRALTSEQEQTAVQLRGEDMAIENIAARIHSSYPTVRNALIRLGAHTPGERRRTRVLQPEHVDAVAKALEEGRSLASLCREHRVSDKTIRAALAARAQQAAPGEAPEALTAVSRTPTEPRGDVINQLMADWACKPLLVRIAA